MKQHSYLYLSDDNKKMLKSFVVIALLFEVSYLFAAGPRRFDAAYALFMSIFGGVIVWLFEYFFYILATIVIAYAVLTKIGQLRAALIVGYGFAIYLIAMVVIFAGIIGTLFTGIFMALPILQGFGIISAFGLAAAAQGTKKRTAYVLLAILLIITLVDTLVDMKALALP
jgi:hypothetical protein